MPERKKKINSILNYFGIGKKKQDKLRTKYREKDLSVEEVFNRLQNKTGKHQQKSFEGFQGDNPKAFGLGDYGISIKDLKKARKHAQKEAKNDTQYQFNRFDKDYNTQQQRGSEDYQTGLDTMQTGYDRNLEDLSTQRSESDRYYNQDLTDFATGRTRLGEDYTTQKNRFNTYGDRLAEDYATQQQQNALNQEIENENLMTSLNQAGAYNSGREILNKQRLAQQQGFRSGALDSGYNRGVEDMALQEQGLDTNYQRGLSDYDTQQTRRTADYGDQTSSYDTYAQRLGEDQGTNLQQYNRNYDRSVFDLNQLYKRGMNDLKRQRRRTRDQYYGTLVNNMANNY